MPKLTLNRREIEFDPGQTILDVAKKEGIQIPTLCHMKGLAPINRCRICVVEVDGADALVTACSTEAEEGMDIRTHTPRVLESRRATIRRMLDSGMHNCVVSGLPVDEWNQLQVHTLSKPWHSELCPAWGDCRLQDLAIQYGVDGAGAKFEEREYPLDDDYPMIVRDFSRCIQCGRCVAACNRVQANLAISEPDRLPNIPDSNGEYWYPAVDYANCTHCGECVQACPVGALFEKKAFGSALAQETEKVRTSCPYCGVGCQLWLHMKEDRIVKVTGVKGAEPNQGRLCVKGRFGYDFIYSEERLRVPLIRENGELREASWDEALDLVARRFTRIREEHGPDAIAGVSCARSSNEDSYNMQKLFRAVIGTNNIDHCART